SPAPEIGHVPAKSAGAADDIRVAGKRAGFPAQLFAPELARLSLLGYGTRSELGRLPPSWARAIAFGFSDLSVAVIPAQAGIQGRVTGFVALDSRFRGNERGGEGRRIGTGGG